MLGCLIQVFLTLTWGMIASILYYARRRREREYRARQGYGFEFTDDRSDHWITYV